MTTKSKGSKLRDALLNSKKPDKFHSKQPIEIELDDLLAIFAAELDRIAEEELPQYITHEIAETLPAPAAPTDYFHLGLDQAEAALKRQAQDWREEGNG